MMAVPNWVRPTDALGAIQAGSQAGLAVRAANQRDAEMAQRAQLAMLEEQRRQEQAAEQLRYHYDALAQAQALAQADDEMKREAFEENKKQNAADILIKQNNSDALAKYREGVLRNQEARNKEADARLRRPYHDTGHGFYQYDPASNAIKPLMEFPEKKSAIPRLSLPLDPDVPEAGRLSALANDPLINRIFGTNSPPGTGTNYVSSVAPMPTLRSQSAPVDESPEPSQEFKKGTRVRQGGTVYEFDGENWIEVE